MNRIFLPFIALLSALTPLVFDSALKGVALLALAAVCALALTGASAAARHLVWLVAVLALLIVPVLSIALPQWRVLPKWAAGPAVGAAPASATTDGKDGTPATPSSQPAPPPRPLSDAAAAAAPLTAPQPSDAADLQVPASQIRDFAPADSPPTPRWREWREWREWLPLVWAAGFALLALRLLAAHVLLRHAARRCVPVPVAVALAPSPTKVAAVPRRCEFPAEHPPRIGGVAMPLSGDGGDAATLAATLAAACMELGIRQRVTLLMDEGRTIPVVWGVFRPRLMLPDAAREWNAEQLRSVLLHELAHIKRRDTLVQWLTQIACALHWWNPLVWLAAWRLHVERERACDDLVLASGVRPSAYAEHLLDVATKLSPARWTQACGLAMARKSSLEGRLLAVLDEKLNRRGVTRTLALAAVVLGAAVAIPVAMLHAADEDYATAADPGAAEGPRNANSPGGYVLGDAAHLRVTQSTLDPATEAQLDWGGAVNGLRGALLVRSPAAGKPQGIYLVVQNVSGEPLHFADTIEAERLRTLYLSASGRILQGLGDGVPTQTDVVLQPREVVSLPMMATDDDGEKKSLAAAVIEGLRKDSLQTWRAVLAMEKAPEGAWTGKLTTGETRAAVSEGGPQPNEPKAQALFKIWQDSARLNGDIPGGLMRLLHEKMKEFIRNNEPDASGGPYARKMAQLEPRFASPGDWKAADVVALLDDIAAAHTIPLETTLEHLERHTLQRGLPLPASLEDADWGAPLESGLRMAYVLEPRATAYRLGTELRARIVLHNSGREPVAFVTTSFQQPGHTAKLAGGGELVLDSTFWTTLGGREAYRLAPGEYCAIHTPGLGIGAQNKDRDDWANVRVGSWIHCAEGNEVVFAPGNAMLFYDRDGAADPDWWLKFITERLNREAPVPTDTKEREYLLYRVVRELYGAAPSTTEGDAFAADKSPDALKNLAALLAKHPYGQQSHGLIRAGTTTFRVLPPDADAAKRPRVANNPGWYTLRDDVRFSVTRRAEGERAVNEASMIYFQEGEDNVVHHVPLPDGYDTWAAALEPGTTVMWLQNVTEQTLTSYDFSELPKVKEHRFTQSDVRTNPPPMVVDRTGIAMPLVEAMRAALPPLEMPKADHAPDHPPPAAPASSDAPADEKPNGASAGLEPAGLLGRWHGKLNGQPVVLVFRRQSPVHAEIRVEMHYPEEASVDSLDFATISDGSSAGLVRIDENGKTMPFGRVFPRSEGVLRFVPTDGHSSVAVTRDIILTREREEPRNEPRGQEARELFAGWKAHANEDGTIPGKWIPMLAKGVRDYADAHSKQVNAQNIVKLLPRFDADRNWTQQEMISLLDDVAYFATEPIEALVSANELPRSPLWRTEVAFEDIPVPIAQWSEPLRGLRIGMRIAGGEWRIGGKVRVELWLHNAGGQDVTFITTGPNRADAGLSATATGADGTKHSAVAGSFKLLAPQLPCTLTAGHVAKVKDFELPFADGVSETESRSAPKFVGLKPGEYSLRCTWLDAASLDEGKEWKGTLTTPEMDFTLAEE